MIWTIVRKGFLTSLLVLVGTGCGGSKESPVDAGGETDSEVPGMRIVFADSSLEAAVREELGKQEGALNEEELLSIEQLDAAGRNIAELGGIEGLKSLRLLNLAGNQIVVVMPRSGHPSG